MATKVDGLFLNRTVIPMLMREVEYRINLSFIGAFKKLQGAEKTKLGVIINVLDNGIKVMLNVKESDELSKSRVVGKHILIDWKNFTTEVKEYTVEELRTLAFQIESEIRKDMLDAVMESLLMDALYSAAPTEEFGKTPIIATTGDVVEGTNRKKLTPSDVIKARQALKNVKKPWLVLNNVHFGDLADAENASSKFKEYTANLKELKPIDFAGFKIVNEDFNIYYTQGKNKVATTTNHNPATHSGASIILDPNNAYFENENFMFTGQDVTKDITNAIPKGGIRLYGNYVSGLKRPEERAGAIIDGKQS